MKIKRYMAASMRVALAQVRAEQGPDAVILSTRRIEEGIEVIAAVDYDEALIAGAARQYAQAAAAAAMPAVAAPAAIVALPAATPPTAAPRASVAGVATPRTATLRATATAPARAPIAIPAHSPAAPPRPAGVRPPSKAAPPAAAGASAVAAAVRGSPAPPILTASTDETRRGFASMQREFRDLRKLLESELASISWHDKRAREPLKARVLEELTAMDIAPDVASALAALTPARTSLDDTSKIPLALLLRHIPVVDRLSTVNGGIFAIVGPTGAGKTTTIAKLAARWTMQHGSRDLALVSTDAYRIGAREQLMTYSRILGATMHAPNSGNELARVLERVKTKRLVLIDTAGMGPRDARLTEQLSALQMGAPRARFMLALPAQGEGHALEEIIRAFAPVSPAACIITKVDEAASLGAVISCALRHKLKIAYLCNGQRVPEDLHSAHQRRVWLVRAAQKLAQHAPLRGDDAYYARNFTNERIHA